MSVPKLDVAVNTGETQLWEELEPSFISEGTCKLGI